MSGDADDDDDELSSGGSGDEVHVINGHNKRIPTAPSGGSGPSRRRNRKAGGVAIVEAMLELAAASKMRAAALTKKNGDNSQGVWNNLWNKTFDIVTGTNTYHNDIILVTLLPMLKKKFIDSN